LWPIIGWILPVPLPNYVYVVILYAVI